MVDHKLKDPDEILESAPPGTPPLFLGIAFILTAFLSSFLAVYVALSPDIKEWIGLKKETQAQQFELDKKIYETNSQSVLGIVATYTGQIAELSKSVGALDKENSNLQYKVKTIEGDITRLQKSLESCKEQLAACEYPH